MVGLSNSDFSKIVRLLKAIASRRWESSRDRETGRRAALLLKKLSRKRPDLK